MEAIAVAAHGEARVHDGGPVVIMKDGNNTRALALNVCHVLCRMLESKLLLAGS